MTHITLHQSRLNDETDAIAFQQLAAQLGYLRLSGYRVALQRSGMRSKLDLVNPATGGIALQIPDKHPGKLFGGGNNARSLLTAAKNLPAAGPPPDLQNPELLRQTLLALAIGDPSTSGAQAAELPTRRCRWFSRTRASARRQRWRRPSSSKSCHRIACAVTLQ